MGRQKHRTYTKDFKERAVKLAEELGSAVEASRKLGIANPTLHRWVAAEREKVEGPREPEAPTAMESAEDELKRLRKENATLKKVNTILKAAAAVFSQDHLE